MLIGAASAGLLAGCGCNDKADRVSRDVYQSQEDCALDFSASKCERVSASESPIRGEAVVLGPKYPAPERPRLGVSYDPRIGSRAIAVFTDDVRRGGFGLSAACRQGSSYTG